MDSHAAGGSLQGVTGNKQSNKVLYLRHLDLFLSLTDAEIEEIARALDDYHIPAGAELILPTNSVRERAEDGYYYLRGIHSE